MDQLIKIGMVHVGQNNPDRKSLALTEVLGDPVWDVI